MPAGLIKCFSCNATLARSWGSFAFLKCVPKLRLFSDTEEELRLCQQCQRLESALNASGSQRREVDMGGDVLLAWRFVRRRAGGVLTVTHDGVAMASRQLLFPRVAVINHDNKATSALFLRRPFFAVIPTEDFSPSGGTCCSPGVKCLRDALHPLHRQQRRLHALALLRMNTVAIEEFSLRLAWRNEPLHELPILDPDPQPAAIVHYVDGKRIEELIAEDNDVVPCRRRRRFERLEDTRSLCPDVLGQPFLQSIAQMRRLLHQRVIQSAREFRELLRRPIQHIAREQATARSQLKDIDAPRCIQRVPYLLELPRQQPPKHGMNVARGVKVSSFAELLPRARIVAKIGLIETHLHVAREWHWTIAANLVLDALAQARFRTRAAFSLIGVSRHNLLSRSICWFSLRCCGVRTNISTR